LLFFSTPARKTVFSLLMRASFAALFSLDFFVRLKKYQHAKKLQQPLEPFHLKLSLSYMVHRTFSSKWHLQADRASRASSVGSQGCQIGPVVLHSSPTDAHSGRGRGYLVLTCLQPFCLLLGHSSSVARVAACSPVLYYDVEKTVNHRIKWADC